MRWLLYLILVILVPKPAFAAVRISEIAWMGDHTSANNEWIELHNTGTDTVDVTDWTVTGGTSLNMTLTGSIGAGQFVVLERYRSSGQYIFNPPWFIYTGALVNTGVNLTLTLSDDAGVMVDTVHGGDDWSVIGGDNSTKDTAQYTNIGWITATSTPGRANGAVVEPVSVTPPGLL